MLNLLVLRSPDPAAITAFYQLFLPPFDHHQHGSGPMHHSVELEGLVFGIYPLLKNQTQADHSTRLGFRIKDLDATLIMIQQAGHDILVQAYQSEWGYRAVVQGPDGRKVELLT